MATGVLKHRARRASKLARPLFLDTSGATSIEYAMIAVIVSISIVTGSHLIGSGLSSTFTTIADQFALALAK